MESARINQKNPQGVIYLGLPTRECTCCCYCESLLLSGYETYNVVVLVDEKYTSEGETAGVGGLVGGLYRVHVLELKFHLKL